MGVIKDFDMGKINGEHCDQATARQKKLFDYKLDESAHGLVPPEPEVVLPDVDESLLPTRPCEDGPVECVRSEKKTPPLYLASLLTELRNRPEKPMSFGVDQLSFLALIVAQIEKIIAFAEGGAEVSQEVVLLIGQGGSGKK